MTNFYLIKGKEFVEAVETAAGTTMPNKVDRMLDLAPNTWPRIKRDILNNKPQISISTLILICTNAKITFCEYLNFPKKGEVLHLTGKIKAWQYVFNDEKKRFVQEPV